VSITDSFFNNNIMTGAKDVNGGGLALLVASGLLLRSEFNGNNIEGSGTIVGGLSYPFFSSSLTEIIK
jgi:hypothetical protein